MIISANFQPESLSNGSTVVRAGQTAANTLKLQAYDIDQGAFDDIITLSSHATLPTVAIASDGLASIQGITFPSGTYKMYRNTTTDAHTLCMQAYQQNHRRPSLSILNKNVTFLPAPPENHNFPLT